MLECCAPLELVKEKGITFEQFVCLAKCHGLAVQARRHDQRYIFKSPLLKLSTFEEFKNDLLTTSTEPGCHMVVSFDRGAMGQTGIGHFSPIGAYHSTKGLALVLDVARFKYPSYWAPIDKLWYFQPTKLYHYTNVSDLGRRWNQSILIQDIPVDM